MENMKNIGKLIAVVILTLSHNLLHAQSERDSNQALSAKQQQIVAIASLTAKGDLQQLEEELSKGLESGLTVNETKEVLVYLYVYCGFPRSIRGLQTLLSVLDERKTKGIEDDWGKEASPITDTRDKYTRGVETLEELIQAKLGPKPAYQQFSPAMDTFLKEHLFADIFERDVLTYAQRELTTISVIATLGGLEPMLRSHLGICLNVGLTPGQLQHFVSIIESTIGKKEAKAAQAVLDEVLKAAQSGQD